MHLNKEVYKAAIYLRISRDDEDKSESDSIQNQRELLKAFIDKDPQIELIDEFIDDGYTGTNSTFILEGNIHDQQPWVYEDDGNGTERLYQLHHCKRLVTFGKELYRDR